MTHISFTEEMVLNKAAMPTGMEDFRYYRAEIHLEDDTGYPIEEGHLYLPPMVDISLLEDFINDQLN